MQPMRKAYQEATIQSGIWQVGESQDLDGAFLGLGNQWICRVSYVCIEQIILNKQRITVPSLSSITGWTSHILLAYIIPWISKSQPCAIYIACIMHACHANWDQSEFRKLYCAVEFVSVIVALKLSLSRSRVGLRLHDWGASIDVDHVYTPPQCIDDLLPHAQLQQCSY